VQAGVPGRQPLDRRPHLALCGQDVEVVVTVAGDGQVPHPAVMVGGCTAAVGVGGVAAGGAQRFTLGESGCLDPLAFGGAQNRWPTVVRMASAPPLVLTVRSYRSVSWWTKTAVTAYDTALDAALPPHRGPRHPLGVAVASYPYWGRGGAVVPRCQLAHLVAGVHARRRPGQAFRRKGQGHPNGCGLLRHLTGSHDPGGRHGSGSSPAVAALWSGTRTHTKSKVYI
jgi:hypothetical protein